MTSTEDLRLATDAFLIEELPRSFRIIGSPPYPVEVGTDRLLEEVSDTRIEIGFYRGSHLANYRVHSLGSVLDLNVMLNVRKMVVSYKMPCEWSSEDEALRKTFDFALVGARHTGFEIQWLDHRVPGQPPAMEIRCLILLKDAFLETPTERLFMANDLALMTRAIIRCMQQHERSLQTASENA